MATDRKPIVNELDGYRVEVNETPVPEKKRDGFHHNLIKKLSQAQILVGIASILLGILIEIFGALIICEIYCYGVYFSLIGAGMWCGLVFIGVGIIGRYAAKKKSTCLIVALMAVGVSTSLFAVVQIGLSMAAVVEDRNSLKIYINESQWDDNYRLVERSRRTIPVTVFVLNLIQALLGLTMFGLLISSSVVSCAATCCFSKPNYLRINLFEAVPTSGATYSQPMQMAPQPYVMPENQMYYAPPGYGGNAQPTMQPVFMMPMNPQAHYQYPLMGQPYQEAPTPPQANPQTTPVTQEATTVPTQEV